LRRGSRIRSLCDGGEDCVSCVFLFLVLRQQHKKKLSQGGERSEATSASEMVPSMVRCSCILFGIALGLVVLKFFFRREPSLKCPKMAPRTLQKRIQGGGFTHVHIPLEDPPLRWGYFLGWCDSSQDLCGCGGGDSFCDVVVAYGDIRRWRGLCGLCFSFSCVASATQRKS